MRKQESVVSGRTIIRSRKISSTVGLAVFGMLVLFIAQATYGQEAAPGSNDEKIQELVKQVQELQAQVKALEARQPNAVAAVVVAPAPAAAVAAAPEAAPVEDTSYVPPLGIKLRLFGDVGYHVSVSAGRHQYFLCWFGGHVHDGKPDGSGVGAGRDIVHVRHG